METVFNEIQHSVKNWWASLGNRVYYCSPLADVCTFKQLCSSKYRIQHIHVDKRYLGNPLCSQQSKRCAKLGLVYRGRNHRRYSRHLPDCLSHGQHGSHSVYHSLLAHVPRLLLHRLLDRPETLWYSRLGLVHGFRYPCHYMFLIDIVATGHRCTLRGLYDFFHFPHYRTIPCHAFL